MSSVSSASAACSAPNCAVCGKSISHPGQECPHCHASAAWQDLFAAMAFLEAQLTRWAKAGLITPAQLSEILQAESQSRKSLVVSATTGKPLPEDMGFPTYDHCWNCNARLSETSAHCPECSVPVQGAVVSELRYLYFVCAQVRRHNEAQRLPLFSVHALINNSNRRIAILRANLEKQRPPVAATVVAEPAATSGQPDSVYEVASSAPDALSRARPKIPPRVAQPQAQPKPPKRPLWEILLDPRSIQWLLGLGGALLVVGLVIWLATLGLFDNPLMVAIALGVGNTALLGGGWAVTSLTRYQTTGRALTLLACLVMPLNLWFYHRYDLVTLDGHLWVAALVCCVFYAASARVLKDALFVYVFAGGVAMTGLLMLADVGRFWDIAAPSTLLVALGLICLHVERAFADIEGPFSRKRFGMAFFWSGQVLLASGLLLLLGTHIVGDWLYTPFFAGIYKAHQMSQPDIVTAQWGQLLALALVLAGTYAYVYSDLVVRRVGLYIYLAVLTVLWAEALLIGMFAITWTTEAVIIAMALTAMAANLFAPSATRWQKSLPVGQTAESLAFTIRPLEHAARPLGLLLSTLPVLLGIVLHLRATYEPLQAMWKLPGGEHFAINWLYVAAMFTTAISCRVGAYVYRHRVAWLSTVYFFGTAASTIVGMAGLLSLMGLNTWNDLGPALMLIPIVYAVTARLYRGHSPEKPLLWAGQAATAVMLLAVLAAWANWTPAHIFEPKANSLLNLSLALVFAEAAVFYALLVVLHKRSESVYLCTLTLCGAVWQLLLFWQVGAEYYTLAFAIAGLVLLVGYRLALLQGTRLDAPAFHSANAMMSLSFVAAALLVTSRLLARLTHVGGPVAEVHYSLVGLLAALAVLSLLAAWLVRQADWRRWYLFTAITEAALLFLALQILSNLGFWQKLEIFTIAAGCALLVVGHIGWHREQNEHSDVVSFSLSLGSLWVAAPLAIAVLVHRFTPFFSTPNELGMLLAGIVLLGTGFMFHIRSTTISGAALLMIYLLTMVLYINMLENVQTAAIWMTIGGGVIFGAGLVLSIYRERLLTLPDRVKRREGIFRVLTWR